jgi:hypothetical protein
MKRRIASFAVFLVILVLVGIEVIGMADANPMVPKNSDNGFEKPVILIISPLNNEALNSTSNLYLNFVVNYPPSWKKIQIDNYTLGHIDSLDISIDGVKSNHFVNSYSYNDSNYNFTDFSINLKTLDAGSHLANITVYAHSYSLGYIVGVSDNSFPPLDTSIGTLYSFPITVFETVNFTINQQMQPSPTPAASQNMPTINTGPTLPVELNPPVIYIILAVVIIIVALASVSLVYFRRRKGKN